MPPIRQHPRRAPPAHREVVKELLDQMKRNDVIQPSSSAWASPIVLAKKKDGGVRFCVGFRRMNKVTRKDAYPLPRIDDTLRHYHSHSCFLPMDLASEYWQVELAEESHEKTAFMYCGRTVRVQSDVVWAVQRPGDFSTTYGPCSQRSTMVELPCLHR